MRTITAIWERSKEMSLPIRLAMLVSGSGTTAEFILRACTPPGILYGLVEPVILIGSDYNIGAFRRLSGAGYRGPSVIVSNKEKSPEEFGEQLLTVMKQERVQWFGQYGWLPKTPENVIAELRGINQHPALTPYFGGKGFYGEVPHAAALIFGKTVGGDFMTTYPVAQLVEAGYDMGDILATSPVQMFANDTVGSLQARVLRHEWWVQVNALLRIADNKGDVPKPIPCPVRNPAVMQNYRTLLGQAREQALCVDYE